MRAAVASPKSPCRAWSGTKATAPTISVRTQKLETDSVSGSIDLTLDTLPAEVDAETTDGNIVMQLRDLSTLPSPLPVEFKTTSGKLSSDVTLTTVQDAAWEFQTVSGSVNLCTIK